MTSLIYNTGTVTVTNGSATVTGSLTGWAVALVTGGVFSCANGAVPIASVESDTSLTLAYPWAGSSGSGKAYAIARDTSEATARAATWTVDRLARLAQTPWGVGVIPDGRGTLAERDAVTPLPNDDYCWLRVEVDEPAELYFRDGGVWLGPYPFVGETGAQGPIGEGLTPAGAWDIGTTYNTGDYVESGGRTFASKEDGNVGNVPPASDTDDAHWMFVPTVVGPEGPQGPQGIQGVKGDTGDTGPAGADGTGTGDFVGPANSADGEVVLFNGTTGKAGKRGPLLNIAPRVPVNDGVSVTVDFDTITAPGWYNRLLTDDGTVHGPGVASRFYYVQVIESAGGNLIQVAYPYRVTTEKTYIRSRFSGTWTAWKQLAYADEVVQPARSVSTQHSLTGGGDLSANRTLSLVNDTASPGNNKVYGTDGSGARGWKDDPAGGGGVSRGHIFGLTLANNATDATNDIDIAAGQCASSDVDPVLIILASALTKRLDAAWAVGNNNGGLDTGSIANTTYHVWLIRRPDTGVVDALFSASATSPTMPANYTQKRRIGSIVRASAAIRGFQQSGDTFWWNAAATTDVSVTNQGVTPTLRTLTLPVGLEVEAILTGNWFNVNATLSIVTPGFSGVPMTSYSNSTFGLFNTRVLTNTSAQISTVSSAAASSQSFRVDTLGWVDTRGAA